MSQSNIYGLCCRYHGRDVRLTGGDGRVHYGRITRVTRNHVWLRPFPGPRGYGFFFYGGYGFGIPFAIGAITGVALASAFFW
ncbi:hypothetical protein [Halobacillus sp. K22]|uniref:hypothetical protein n=1 Tax=Halobacillus sp. K22 TaxID=3457431 RepID=UPI003FCCB7D2